MFWSESELKDIIKFSEWGWNFIRFIL